MPKYQLYEEMPTGKRKLLKGEVFDNARDASKRRDELEGDSERNIQIFEVKED